MAPLPPVCFIVLQYDPRSHRHWFHLYHFIDLVARTRRVMLIIEQADQPPDLPHVERIALLRGNPVTRRLHRALLLFRARLSGYRVFYNHYTFRSARLSGLITRLTGGRSYLWHCIPLKDLHHYTDTGIVQKFLFRITLGLVHYLVTGSSAMANYYRTHFNLAAHKVVVVPN
ncbi:hypothetical protein JW905_16610, partial [bacterium]|nr:hypothetical protein [candidate division CSSED10-310 bacterium]